MKLTTNNNFKLLAVILIFVLLVVNVLGIPVFGTDGGLEAVDEIGNIEYYVTSKT